MTGHVYLSAEGLFSKWGFGDGDEPDHVVDWFEERRELGISWDDLHGVWHDVLRTLVRGLLLPVLPAEVSTYDVETIHNPIRAEAVDGVEVEWVGGSAVCPFPDVAIEVPMSQVVTVVREVLDGRGVLK